MVSYKTNEDDISLINELYSKVGNVTETAKKFCETKKLEYSDSSRKRISGILKRHGLTKSLEEIQKSDIDMEEDYSYAKKRKLRNSKYYIITWEQNKTPLHENLWNNILAYKKFLNAELSVVLGRYQNPTSVFSDKEHDTWNEKTKPYWDANRHDIHKYLTVLSDVKIQPTAASPLTGLEMITGETTTIVGHPKSALKSIPIMEGHPKKLLLTTGSVTLPNYTDSKAGKRAEFHHSLGFVIVEIKDEEVFFIRQVEADEKGNFIDLYYEVFDGQVYDLDYSSAVVWGDTHYPSTDKRIIDSTRNLVDRLGIEYEIHHDLIDGASVNNHIVKNPVEQFKRLQEQKDDIQEELDKVVEFLKDGSGTKKVIVQSNHNDRFDRWVINQDWKKDIKNALPYLKYTTAVLEGKADKGVLAYVLENEFSPDEVICLDYDDSFIINGYELAHHGHLGSNGTKGNIESFRRMSTKMIIAHSHTPSKIDKVVCVGTSSALRESYNKGASSWLQSHAIIHKNGTVQHIIFVDGEYTTFK